MATGHVVPRMVRRLSIWGQLLILVACATIAPPQAAEMVAQVGGKVQETDGAYVNSTAPHPKKVAPPVLPPPGTSLDKIGPGLGLSVNAQYGTAIAPTRAMANFRVTNSG